MAPEAASGFIMLKPDGIERDVRPELNIELAARNISIIGETAIKTTCWTPLELWPTIGTHNGWLYSREYIEGHTLPVLWLGGDQDVPEAALAAKKELRQRLCSPEERRLTLMHCPDTEKDFERESTVLAGYEVSNTGEYTPHARRHQALANWLGSKHQDGFPVGNISMILTGSSAEPWSDKAHDWDYTVFTSNDEGESTLTSTAAEWDHPAMDVRVISVRQWVARYGMQSSIDSENLRWILQAKLLRDDNGRFGAIRKAFADAFDEGKRDWLVDAYVSARAARHAWAHEAHRGSEEVRDILSTDFAVKVQQLAYLAMGEPFPALKHTYNAAKYLGTLPDEHLQELGDITPRALRKLHPARIESYSRHIFKQLLDPLLSTSGALDTSQLEWWNITPQNSGSLQLRDDFNRRIALIA